MDARFGRLVSMVLLLAAAADCGTQAPPTPSAAGEPGPKRATRLGPRVDWKASSSGPALRLELLAEELEATSFLEQDAQVVPLADGRILASATVGEWYDNETCYLLLMQSAGGWRPDQVGVEHVDDLSLPAFVENLEGRVLADPSSAERPFRCLVELGPRFQRVLRIDPTGDSYLLREELTLFEGGPLPRR